MSNLIRQLLAGGSLLILGCSSSGAGQSERLERTTAALSDATTRILGFESLPDWSAHWSSPALALSDLHSEGQKSLSVSGGGWMQVQSGPLPKESAPPTVVGYDVRVPASPVNPSWWGSTQLQVDAPSAGIFNQFVGQANLTELPAGQFSRVEFAVSPSLQVLLGSPYTDLRLRLVLNVPNNETAAYLVDRFTWGPSQPTCTPEPDGNPCTDDVCSNGVPAWVPRAPGTACDTNDTVCDGVGACDATGACLLGDPPIVDDGNPCTADACDPVTGPVHLPMATGVSCESDGNLCNGTSLCDGAGVCAAGAPPPVDDGNPCTVDTCDPASGVMHDPVAVGTSCDSDADQCNGVDLCNAAAVCVPGQPPTIDDGDPCTADSCNPATGVAHAAVPNGSVCDDGSACTSGDVCTGGVCAPGVPKECPSIDQCHDAGVCDPASGVCSTPPKIDGSACNDSDACTQVDQCQQGVCAGTSPVVCAALDSCHLAGACNSATGVCSHPAKPAGAGCADGNLCNGAETCNEDAQCVLGPPPVLDDGDPCTQDLCDPIDGVTHPAAPAGTVCGVSAYCEQGGFCQPVAPPDPATVAPPINRTTTLPLVERTEFLHTGPFPTQTGVQPGALDPSRTSVVRGRVVDSDSEPIALVAVEVLGHPELGGTRTRLDGTFDLVVSGGEQLVIVLSSPGTITATRNINAPWNDSVVLDDVVLVALDPATSTVVLGSGSQLAEGSRVSDGDGTRRARLFFQPGTTAEMVLPDESIVPLDLMSVHITEFTRGPDGPAAMPADLPATSAYTYAVEFTAEEAAELGATTTRFNQAASLYVDNFLGFPVGGLVPAGSYDREQGRWFAEKNGRVIRILSVTGGLATVDVTGSGSASSAAALAALGITSDELAMLAATYTANQQLWRVPVGHFTLPLDANWPYAPDDSDPPPPDPPAPSSNEPTDDSPLLCGSVIDVAGQILGERLPIAGTDLALHYASDRARGRRDQYRLRIPVSGSSPGSQTLGFDVQVNVAGRVFKQTFAPAANLEWEFEWDGYDAYGRLLQGRQVATISIGRTIPAVYTSPSTFAQAFGLYSNQPSVALTSDRARQQITLRRQFTRTVGSVDLRDGGVGGWSIDAHHWYDPAEQVLYRGDGKRRSVSRLGAVVEPYAGLPFAPVEVAHGLPARNAEFADIESIAVGPDGALFIAAKDVYRVDPKTHVVHRIVGSPPSCTGTPLPPDGGPALTSCVGVNKAIAIAPNGVVYLADRIGPQTIPRIRRIDADGSIHTVAGGVPATGPCTFQGNGGPIASARLCSVIDLALAPDGSLYTFERGASEARLRRITTDGYVTSPVPGVLADVGNGGIDVGRDGSVYVTDADRHAVDRLTPSREYFVVAGTFTNLVPGYAGDGGPGNAALLNRPNDVTVAPDGTLFVSDQNNGAIRVVDSVGIINTFAGGPGRFNQYTGDNGPPGQAGIGSRTRTALSPDGTLYIAQNDRTIRRVRPATPGGALSAGFLIAHSETEVDEFDKYGRHLRTLHGLTGAVRRSFEYDAAGLLVGISDGDGNVTTIVRDAAGQPVRLEGPYGHTTTLVTDAHGHLAIVRDPSNAETVLQHRPDGLLDSMQDANGGLYTFNWDPFGRLTRDQNPRGGFKSLEKAITPAGSSDVSGETAEGVAIAYASQKVPTGDEQRSFRVGLASPTLTTLNVNHQREVITSPDGTVRTTTLSADPRWGMTNGLPTSTTLLPSGQSVAEQQTAQATGASAGDPFALQTLLSSVSTSGATPTTSSTSTVLFDRPTLVQTSTSAVGRTTATTLDLLGRPVRLEAPGLEPTILTYDGRGRLATNARGSRQSVNGYDAAGNLHTVTNALLQTDTFDHDAVGRVIARHSADGATTQFGYDALGNNTSVTPPGRPAHFMTYTADNLLQSYGPPPVGGVSTDTTYEYDLDGKLTRVNRPDGTFVDTEYDASGRRQSVTIPGASAVYDYHATTAQLLGIVGPYQTDLAYTHDGPLLTGINWAGAVQGSVLYGYDQRFRRAQQTVLGTSGSAVTRFGYDADNLLTCASSSSCSPPAADALQLDRSATTGLLEGVSLGNVTETLTYNAFGELASRIAEYDGQEIYAVTYDTAATPRDALGRVTRKVETVLGSTCTEDYSYDAAGRLTDVLIDNTAQHHWAYDPNGNRLSADPCVATAADYDSQDRLTACGAYTFTYSPTGHLQTKTDTSNSQVWLYQYDPLGNLLSVTLPDGRQIEYLVDGEGRRVGKKINGAIVQRWLYRDTLSPLAELDATGALVSEYVYAAGSTVPDYVSRGGSTYRIISDQLGSPRVIVNVNTGAIAQQMSHDAWGNVLTDSSPGFVPFGFAGGLYDADTGLVMFGARDYDPSVGRWLSKDPIGFGGGQANLYVYVGNDPINRKDPTGLEPWFLIPDDSCERSSGLFGGACGGPDEGDSYRHCLASCEITQRYGHAVATWLGALNELTSPRSAESDRDAGNNELGCGFGEDPDVDCSLRCYSAAINGELYGRPGGDEGY